MPDSFAMQAGRRAPLGSGRRHARRSVHRLHHRADRSGRQVLGRRTAAPASPARSSRRRSRLRSSTPGAFGFANPLLYRASKRGAFNDVKPAAPQNRRRPRRRRRHVRLQGPDELDRHCPRVRQRDGARHAGGRGLLQGHQVAGLRGGRARPRGRPAGALLACPGALPSIAGAPELRDEARLLLRAALLQRGAHDALRPLEGNT